MNIFLWRVSQHSEDKEKYSAKPSKADPRRMIYTCGIGDIVLGKTRLTPIQAIQGSVIRVSVSGIREESDGTLSWLNPEVLGAGEVEDKEAKIRKMAGRKK